MNEDRLLPEAPCVLVVEDHADTLETLRILLKCWGFRTYAAKNGAQALEFMTTCCPAAVLLDIGMPGMDGWELTKRLRLLPGMDEVLMIAISGYDREEHRRKSLEAGCDFHLIKPVDPVIIQQLLSRVKDLIVCRPTS